MSDDDKPAEVVAKPEDVNPAPDSSPDPVAKPERADDDLRPVVDQLAATVAELKETVAGIVAVGQDQAADTAPTKKPWTHWGAGR